MKLRKNDKLTLSIFELNNLGYGVAKHEGLTVFVSGAVSDGSGRARRPESE